MSFEEAHRSVRRVRVFVGEVLLLVMVMAMGRVRKVFRNGNRWPVETLLAIHLELGSHGFLMRRA